MSKTSYQVSEASIKRYWKMWESNRKQDDRKHPRDLFNEWSDKEGFSVSAHYDALVMISQDDSNLLRSIIFDYRENKEKLNQISSAFELINSLTKES